MNASNSSRSQTEKMLAIIKSYCATVSGKEHEVSGADARDHQILLCHGIRQRTRSLRRQHNLRESEQHLTSVNQYTRQNIEHTAKQAVTLRKEKLHVLVVMKREELALTIAQREEAVMEAVRMWEVEIDQACMRREEAVWKEVEERVQWVLDRDAALREEEWRLEDIKREGEAEMSKVEAGLAKAHTCPNPSHQQGAHEHEDRDGENSEEHDSDEHDSEEDNDDDDDARSMSTVVPHELESVEEEDEEARGHRQVERVAPAEEEVRGAVDAEGEAQHEEEEEGGHEKMEATSETADRETVEEDADADRNVEEAEERRREDLGIGQPRTPFHWPVGPCRTETKAGEEQVEVEKASECVEGEAGAGAVAVAKAQAVAEAEAEAGAGAGAVAVAEAPHSDIGSALCQL
ncbi:hypothetical protein CVT25_002765 [Psilocybe cyanescens]|uniref:Uncharacterized protein n=1 Tax=Psilocybe cyanescens TaxID=93625 RepID=A0A409X5X1_PSICY|nr:hypothetical protein CVT25_002765 [Psilocybe cyanescens]